MPHTELYERLGVSPNDLPKVIRRAYRKRALVDHPDKGGDAEKFKHITEAYEILSDSDKRKKYDRFGLDAFKGPEGSHPYATPFFSFNDIFNDIFGRSNSHFFNMGRHQPHNVMSKVISICHTYHTTLEDICNGKKDKVEMSVDRLCSECSGEGYLGEIKKCMSCQGQGRKIDMVQQGPMIRQIIVNCSQCSGKGNLYQEENKCPKCSGQSIIKKKIRCPITVDSKINNGSQIVFQNQGNQKKGSTHGDIVITFNIRPHSHFKRSDDDLVYKKNINLVEALCGIKFNITHPNGINIKVSEDRLILKEGFKTFIENSGITREGRLIIWYKITKIPEEIDEVDKKVLKCVLEKYR
jgi:DnaJ homolog subfamily A member 2